MIDPKRGDTVRRIAAAIDASDVAIVLGIVLLAIGLQLVSTALAFIVIGCLLLLYGALPILTALGRR